MIPTTTACDKISEPDAARITLNAVIDLIPETGPKAAYLEAVRCAPHLVETESDPQCFLRYTSTNDGDKNNSSSAACANGNPWEAAKRLINYWDARREAFGRQNYLKPLTLIEGKSALSAQAIRALRTGVLLLLPRDRCGRCVVYADRIRFRALPEMLRLQVAFYATFITMRNHQSLTDGIVLLLQNEHTQLKYDPTAIKPVVNFIRKAIPVRINSIHLIASAGFIDSLFIKFWCWLSNQNTVVHICQTPQQCATKLCAYGFTIDRLPPILGGNWRVLQWDGIEQDEDRRWLSNPLLPSFSSPSPLPPPPPPPPSQQSAMMMMDIIPTPNKKLRVSENSASNNINSAMISSMILKGERIPPSAAMMMDITSTSATINNNKKPAETVFEVPTAAIDEEDDDPLPLDNNFSWEISDTDITAV